MKSRFLCLGAIALLSTLPHPLFAPPATGTAFTYQGRLRDGGTPATGAFDLQFKLYDAVTGGTPLGSTLAQEDVAVTNGLFSVVLDFGGSVFTGEDRWLEIGVRAGADTGDYATLNPRRAIKAVPYALYSPSAGEAVTASTALSASSVAAANVTGTLALNQLPPTLVTNNQGNLTLGGSFTGNGAGLTNLPLGALQAMPLTNNHSGVTFRGLTTVSNLSVNATNFVNYLVVTNPPWLNGSGITNLNASQLTSGTVPLGLLPGAVVTNGEAGVSLTGTFTGHGGGLTNVNADQLDGQHGAFYQSAANLTAGTLPDARLSTNVALLNAAQTFSGINNFTNPANAFAGDGSALVNLNLNRAEGNALTVGQDWGDGPFQIYGSTWLLDQQDANFGYYFSRGSPWQSFTCGTNGNLAAIKAWVYAYAGGPWSATLNVYAGEGTAGALLASQPVAGDGVMQERTFALETPVALTVSNQYTFAFQTASTTLRLRGSGDVYAGGRSDYSAGYDYHFSTWMTNTTAVPVLVVQPNTLYVGIGKANPTSALDVNGTVTASNFVGNAAGLTNLDATDLTGTLADARLSTNVALLNANQAFTGSNRFAGVVTATNVANAFAGTFTGNGTGLTNLPGTFAWQVVSGTNVAAQPNTGYIAANAAQVTVTLPPSPNTGAVVRVSSLGAGGWKIAQNAGQSVLVANLGSFVSSLTSREGNRPWTAVASSADGSKLIAAVDFGQLFVSTDSGVTWAGRENDRHWSCVASSADGSKLVAAERYGGRIYTSTDSGWTWTARIEGANWFALASSADGTKLVATDNNNMAMYTSTDSGATWVARGGYGCWTGVASSADGSKLIAVVSCGFLDINRIYISTDSGTNWTARENNRAWQAAASSADGSKLVAAVYDGQLYTSTDSGTNWTARESNRSWTAVASSADGSKMVAVVNGGQIYTSTDSGVTWTASGSTQAWRSVALSADGSKMAAVTYGGTIYTTTTTYVLPTSSTTTVGTTGYLTGAQNAALELQYLGNGQWLPLSYVGNISAY